MRHLLVALLVVFAAACVASPASAGLAQEKAADVKAAPAQAKPSTDAAQGRGAP